MTDRHLDPPEGPDYSDADWQNHYSLKLRNPSEADQDAAELRGDYLKDQYDDREEEVDDYDYEADDRAFDAARESR